MAEGQFKSFAIYVPFGSEVFLAQVNVPTLLLEDVDPKIVGDMMAGQVAADIRRQLKRWYAEHQAEIVAELPPPES